MRICVIWPVVLLLTTVGTAYGKDPEKPQEGGKTKSPPKELTVDLGGGVKMEFVLIPAGEFMMGSHESAEEVAKKSGKKGAKADLFKKEHPLHKVTITKPFYLGKYEATVGQFRAFVKSTGYKTDAEKDGKGGWGFNRKSGKGEQKPEYTWRNPGFTQTDKYPVANVSWNDAVAFCKWLVGKDRKTYRLPTEAEWEYACRAGTRTAYYHGDDPEGLAKVGNVPDASLKRIMSQATRVIKADDGYAFAAPVGQFKPNEYGLYDMHGNVWEWCQDRYGADYYAKPPKVDPQGPDTGSSRVLRGGGWDLNPFVCRSAYRLSYAPGLRFDAGGFRVVLERY